VHVYSTVRACIWLYVMYPNSSLGAAELERVHIKDVVVMAGAVEPGWDPLMDLIRGRLLNLWSGNDRVLSVRCARHPTCIFASKRRLCACACVCASGEGGEGGWRLHGTRSVQQCLSALFLRFPSSTPPPPLLLNTTRCCWQVVYPIVTGRGTAVGTAPLPFDHPRATNISAHDIVTDTAGHG
jgi:hypothetical protein